MRDLEPQPRRCVSIPVLHGDAEGAALLRPPLRPRRLDWYRRAVHARGGTIRSARRRRPTCTTPRPGLGWRRRFRHAKLVVTLRDPVKRAYSHYWHTHRRGQEDQTFERALELEPRAARQTARAVARSCFSYTRPRPLHRPTDDLEARHDRALIHVMLLEDLIADRVPTLQAVAGVPGRRCRTSARQHRGVSTPTGIGCRNAKCPAARRSAELPTDGRRRPRSGCSEHFADSTQRLADWLGRDLSVWSSG